MNSKSSHWLWLILGILLIIGTAYSFLTFPEYTQYCWEDIMNGDDRNGQFWKDFLYIPGSLILTGLLFYLAGRSLCSCNDKYKDSKKVSELERKLKEYRKKFDELKVRTSGDKIQTSKSSGSFWLDISKSDTQTDHDSKSAYTADTINQVTPGDVEETITTDKPETTQGERPYKSEVDAEIEAKKQAFLKELESRNQGETREKATPTSASFDSGGAKSVFGKKVAENDLKIIEGIGPKIESILKGKGITTWVQLSQTTPDIIRKYLIEVGGASYKIHDPETWPDQSKLAAEGKFEALKNWQNDLKGGKK